MKVEIGKTYDLGPGRVPVEIIDILPKTKTYTEVIVENCGGKRVGLRRRESLLYIEAVATREISRNVD